MTYAKPDALQSPQELAFARAFPEVADATTAEIRIAMAYARAELRAQVRERQRRQAIEDFLRTMPELPLVIGEHHEDPTATAG